MSFDFNPASKYRNKKTELDGIIFDSKKEAKIYLDLKAQKAASEIADFKMQVSFELIPNQKEQITLIKDGFVQLDKQGKAKIKEKVVELAVKYIADFVVYHHDGEVTVVDAKGFHGNQTWIIKRKLLLYVHKLKIKVV